jgi:hypothetical protein
MTKCFQKINPIGFETYRVKLLFEIPSEGQK